MILCIFPSGSGCSGYIYDSKPFLFSLVNKPGWAPLKLSLPGVGGSSSYSRAIYGCSSSGPSFGAGHDLHISDHASSNTNSYTYLGYAYSSPSGYSYGSRHIHHLYLTCSRGATEAQSQPNSLIFAVK